MPRMTCRVDWAMFVALSISLIIKTSATKRDKHFKISMKYHINSAQIKFVLNFECHAHRPRKSKI